MNNQIGEVVIKGEPMAIVKGRYSNSRIAYQAICSNGEVFMKITVNLPEEDNAQLEDGEFFVKTWSENEPYIDTILKSGLFIDTGKRVETGFVTASVWKLADRKAVRRA